jgi:hypothetical protein
MTCWANDLRARLARLAVRNASYRQMAKSYRVVTDIGL